MDGAAESPPRSAMEGRLCRVEPLDPDRHAAPICSPPTAPTPKARCGPIWATGPFLSLAHYVRLWMDRTCLGADPLFHAIVDRSTGPRRGRRQLSPHRARGRRDRGRPHRLFAGAAAPAGRHRGNVADDPRRVFLELGYRRYEWKCDALNRPSRRAAAPPRLHLRGHLPPGARHAKEPQTATNSCRNLALWPPHGRR